MAKAAFEPLTWALRIAEFQLQESPIELSE
jgi:hypothetical protein